MKLVIVESPTKCQTIERYLGPEYKVMASLGHVRDLATSGRGGLGVDVENGFIPTYKISPDKKDVVEKLKHAKAECDEVILATDPDREGEAIAWHLACVLDLPIATTKRLEFHEITREALSKAIKKPRTIDMDLVASQETRRILDRIVGFKLSTFINKTIHSPSAGRVQSAVLGLIKERDDSINNFVPVEFYNINTKIQLSHRKIPLTLVNRKGETIEIHTKEEADNILSKIPEQLKVVSIKKELRQKESKDPFTTSTLQQEAYNRLHFTTKETSLLAQSLYEGLNINGEHVGLITYIRVDSTYLSSTYVNRAKKYITEAYGDKYVGEPKKATPGPHEAIRPTSNHRTPESVRQYLTNNQYQLYKLIYERTLASLMKNRVDEVLLVTLEGNGVYFRFEVQRNVFDGFSKIYKPDPEENKSLLNLPEIKEGDNFTLIQKESEQKFTQPPSHYTEAKLVKAMEEVGIGRPSTYASTISLLKEKTRKYVVDTRGVLTITDRGNATVDTLKKYFPDIIDASYTANMENKLDNVQEGKESRVETLSSFYYPFMDELEKANIHRLEDVETLDILCPKCGASLIKKVNKSGQEFVGCSNFPKCRYVQKEEKINIEVGINCPNCGKPLIIRLDQKGREFIACSGYPKCHYVENTPDTYSPSQYVKDCPDCGGHLVKKKGKYGYFLGCTNFPKCQHMEKIKKNKRS